MGMTKRVNIFDPREREIRCIAKEHDYLGTGNLIAEEDLEIGKIYTFIHGKAASYGNMVYLGELPSRWGYQAYLFEELEPYDEDAYIQKSREWLLSQLDAGIAEAGRGKAISMEELGRKMEELMRQAIFQPHFTEGHDPGAAYWIYPVRVHDADRIEYSDIEEFKEHEISIPDSYFDALLTVFFTDGIDAELPANAHRYSTDIVSEGIPICGFAWNLHPNFYTRSDMQSISQKMTAAAKMLKSGYIENLPSRQKSRLRKAFSIVAEDPSDLTYHDAMNLTADFYLSLIDRLTKMLCESPNAEFLCVMAP